MTEEKEQELRQLRILYLREQEPTISSCIYKRILELETEIEKRLKEKEFEEQSFEGF